MQDVEIWVKLLYTYGPFALLVFFVFVAERKSRTAMRQATTKVRVPLVIVYFANWLVIFALVGFAVYAWDRINLRSEPTIRGTFENLKGSETITSKSADLYLRREYGPQGRFDYKWRLITPKRLADGEKVRFTFDQSTNRSERITEYELTIRASFYDNDDEVHIVYNRLNNQLVMEHRDKKDVLRAFTEAPAAKPRPDRSFFVGTAYAQEPFSSVELAQRLESNDPIIRRDARADLASQGQAALRWIQEVLNNHSSTYRLRLGVISALNQMDTVNPSALIPSALAVIIDASADSDATLRAEAHRYIVKQASWELEAKLDQVLADVRAQTFTGGSTSPLVAELARTELDLLYNLGMFENDKYKSGRPEDRVRIDKSIAAFKKAWELRSLVFPSDRIVFAKALYGWGHALHNRSWIERRLNGKRDPALVMAAQEKFSEFLREIQQAPNSMAYPYPEHLKHAAAYLRNPVPESLQ